MTIFRALLFFAPFDAALKSFVKYVPIPNEAEVALNEIIRMT